MATGVNAKSGLFLLFVVTICVICDATVQDEDDFIDDEDSIDYSSDDVRCYCNLPVCVTSSYMCKSEAGVCFSEPLEDDFESSFRIQEEYKTKHGCLELIEDDDQREECRNMPSGRGSFRGHTRSLFCCFKDMCNHVDSKDHFDVLNTTRMMSDTSAANEMISSPGYNSNEVWFKAAIIAVPICGIVILFLLIFLAVKILKTDSLHTSNKLGVPYPHSSDRKSNRDHFDQVHHSNTSSKKIPLLIHHHELPSSCTNHSSVELLKTTVPLLVQNETGVSYDKKNEAHAKKNLAQGHEYNLVNKENNSPLLGLHKTSNNVYRNVNLILGPVEAPQQVNGEKLYDKKALNSVISWGPSNSSSPV